jgi:putative ABC transport system substrate-binding protein
VRRREFFILVGAVATLPRGARAQPAATPVIGFLNSAAAATWGPFLAAFRDGLREGGYVEGGNVAIEYRWAEGRYEALPGLAAELVARRVSVIAATGGIVAAHAAIAATQTIPIVFTSGGDPVEHGLVASLSRPGGNATGISLITYELAPKRLALIRDLIPNVARIALLVNATNRVNAELELTALHKAVEALGLALQVVDAGTADELVRAFTRLTERRPDALLVGSDAFFNAQRTEIVELAAHYAIPAIYEWPEFVTAGGLMSYGPSVVDAYRQVGIYTSKILNGTKPTDLPVQQPTTFELVVNLRAAKALGLQIPPYVLGRADAVIE